MKKKARIKSVCQSRQNTEISKIVNDMTLFDDDLMSKVFDKNIEAAELLLNIILERSDIRVISVKGQEEFRNPYPKGRNIRLDIHAIDGNGTEFDVEVQRNPKGSHIRRARFHSSMMDTRMLKEKQEFKEIKDTYIIFICQHDMFKQNKPIYHIDRIIRETGDLYDDGVHIIYVNGNYLGDDDIGKLVHDFNCKKSNEMHYKVLADGVKHFKETEKGSGIMCESVERYAKKYAKKESQKSAEISRINTLAQSVKMLMKNTSVSLDQAFNNLGIAEVDRTEITKQLQK